MCLVLIAYNPAAPHPLVVAANRDEFYARQARAAQYWEDQPALLAGRDLTAGGTWLGVHRNGRFATVTNYADQTQGHDAIAEPPPTAAAADRPLSRGALTERFLAGAADADAFARGLHPPAYRGFNLLLFDGEALVYTSNRGHHRTLAPGIYGLANAELGASWPKVIRGERALRSALAGTPDPGRLLDLLADRTVPPDHELPARGRPLELERSVAPCFIAGTDYGTRASTAVIIGRDRVTFAEQEYFAHGRAGRRAVFEFEIER
ncbi:MAG: NRDE family protein [Gammaproteobacteria bacterium]